MKGVSLWSVITPSPTKTNYERLVMADMHIVTEKELNYIETLYLYARLEDFIDYKSTALDYLLGEVNSYTNRKVIRKDILDMYASERYSLMMEYVYDNILCISTFLGVSHGREWYDLGYCRIGIMEYDVAKKSNQFNVEIQYAQSHMFSLGSKLDGLRLPFDGDISQYHIKRIDLTKIVKTKIDYLTNYSYISPYRSIARFGNDVETETVYLGKRSNGNVFRMYNKTIELQIDNNQHPVDYVKIELFSEYFGDIENLYTFELELHRKYLKAQFGINTLADLDKIYQVYSEIVGKIKIYEDNDLNRKLIAQKNYSRVKNTCIFTEYKEYKRISKKRYEPSENYLIEKIVRAVQRYEKSLSKELEEHEKLILADKVLTAMFGNKDISIELNDSEYVQEYNGLMDKIELLRTSQDNYLFKEANKAFAPIFNQDVDKLF